MKIEKISDNQIRCTLSQEDLEARQIKLNELAYGSDKARRLFHEMVQQASEEFGFDVEDMPLMVEAIPSTGNLVLLISKVEYPDELDPRFSRFSDPGDQYSDENMDGPEFPKGKGASEIVDLFRKMESEKEEKKDDASGKQADNKDNGEKKESAPAKVLPNLTTVFSFAKLDDVCSLAKVLADFYQEKTDLLKDREEGVYLLLLHKGDCSPELFNKVCNIATEYGQQENVPELGMAYLFEHCGVIRKGDALNVMKEL